MKRLVVLLVLLVLVLGGGAAVALQLAGDDSRSGTLGGPAAPSASPSGSPSTSPGGQDAPDPELQTFYDQQLAWEPCGSGNECGTIEVPLDYADPTGKKIELALLKNPADEPDERVGNLVVNPGGPGSPGTDYAKNADFAFGAPVRDAFDIIGFDPRGTGSSTAVDCLTDEQLDGYIATDPDPDTPAEVREFSGWLKRIGSGCSSRSGDLAAHVSTVEAARDMDVLRAVLGDDELSYFGASYGTKLGATYAELFPDRAGRLVLDGAVDVSLTSRESSLQQAAGFQTALTAYVDDCLADAPCFLGVTVRRRSTGSPSSSTRSTSSPSPRRPAARMATRSTASWRRSTTRILDTFLTPASRSLRGRRHFPAAALRHLRLRAAAATPTTPSRPTTRSTASTTPRRSGPKVPGELPPSRRRRRPSASVRLRAGNCRGGESPADPVHNEAPAPRRSWSSVPPATRPRPCAWAQALAEAALVGRAGDPGRRRPHRLPLRQ